MPIFTISHVTTYRYRKPVAFGEHRMMLRPRDDSDQIVLDAELDIAPAPAEISWERDHFGNHVGTARFAERSRELRFTSTIRLEHAPFTFRADDISDFARSFPFAYAADDNPYRAALTSHPELHRWAGGFLSEDRTADTYALLVGMTQTIRRTFKHVGRHEKGVQDPFETLTLNSGSCRDLAMLMIEALRSLGIAARFVSGYLHLKGGDDHVTGGNTHAWVQAYVPGPGWVDFDPSSGNVGNENLVRVATVHDPREAIPLSGSWIGSRSDHLAMKVFVKVAAAAP
jgi:transglutaminase-like putative cysteine protease